jgi:hypothetical protein
MVTRKISFPLSITLSKSTFIPLTQMTKDAGFMLLSKSAFIQSDPGHLVKKFMLEYGTACHSEPKVKNLERSETAGR